MNISITIQSLFAQKMEANVLQQKIDLQKFAAGIYTVECITNNKRISIQLMVQQQN